MNLCNFLKKDHNRCTLIYIPLPILSFVLPSLSLTLPSPLYPTLSSLALTLPLLTLSLTLSALSLTLTTLYPSSSPYLAHTLSSFLLVRVLYANVICVLGSGSIRAYLPHSPPHPLTPPPPSLCAPVRQKPR